MNKRGKQLAILNVLRINKVGIGVLLENKLKKEKIDEMMVNLYCGWDYYSSRNSEGMPMEYMVTFVYGLNTVEERLELWWGLSSLHVINRPWLIMGDFNAVFNFDDRVGGRSISSAELVDSNAWLAMSHLVSIKRIGSNFTWSNKQDGEDRIYSRIDHVFINEDWIDELPNSIAEFHWEDYSDHCFCLIKSLKMGSLGIKPFRFFNFWTTHKGFKEVVCENWNKPLVTRGLLGVTRKLLRLKHVLKLFNRREFGDVEQRYHQAKGDYQLALTRAQAAPSDLVAQEAEKSAALLYQENAERREENRIVSFLNERGEIVEDYGAVVQHFLNHFRGYMGSSSSANGYFNAHLGFFRDGKIPEALNETMLALVPKTDSLSRAVDYRPIACCNTLYKCISKMICSRLSEVLPHLISQNQGAFVRGRSLAHNILIFQDLIENYNRKNSSPRCALKIDLSKAYDTVDWCFLERLLIGFRFPIRFVQWVMVCLRGTSYVLMMNGRLQGGFKGVKGLRQGDPISPLLFVLIMEYLTRLLQLGAQQQQEF
ncbi:uncharacterized protein LOC133821750 [Humulus lupulus]|uniref:uncharacterized protein LOC133821750 n=1 Tax=Humulus lupulus TaxID=3486 RepID=UPI002B413DCC|nr:uncharacterized protein LOC133821750 [Humulus lupulus]